MSPELEQLLNIREALNEAVKSQRRLDKCHASFIERTNRDGFTRAQTTSYNANASHHSSALKSDIEVLKKAFATAFPS
ncbi:hypothetical protein [Alteromonas gracilis]|uniref:hypothetical protein n=1 Tax=Alteromonas gracilis TaxID=1479524 RepID=UPI003734C5FB